MSPQSHRRDNSAAGAPAAPLGRPGATRFPRLAHTLRTRWWPRYLLIGALLAIVGITLLSGAAQFVTVILGMLVFLTGALQAMSASNRTPADLEESRNKLMVLKSSTIGSRREPPPPTD